MDNVFGRQPERELIVKKSLLVVALFVWTLSVAQAQKITAAGATFPYPISSKWFNEYSAAHPGVEINYQSIGSGGGIQQVTSGTVDFGASDMPMTDALHLSLASKVKLIHIPTVLGAVVPIYNVTGSKTSASVPTVLADIYLSKITTWNDPRIAKDNPGVQSAQPVRSSSFIVLTAAAPHSSLLTISVRSARIGLAAPARALPSTGPLGHRRQGQ